MCGFSRAVCQILDFHGVRDIAAVNVLEDEALRSEIKKFSYLSAAYRCCSIAWRSSWPTIPQVFVRGNFVGGCDIMLEMHKNGELEKLLVQEGIVEPEDVESSESSPNPASNNGSTPNK